MASDDVMEIEREREKVKFLKRVQTEPSFCFVYILCRYEMRD